MNPKYFQVSLGCKNRPPIGDKSRGGGLKGLWDLLKWKTSVFECSMTRPKLSSNLERTL